MDRIESHGCEEAPGGVEAMHYIGVPHSTQVAVWREVSHAVSCVKWTRGDEWSGKTATRGDERMEESKRNDGVYA